MPRRARERAQETPASPPPTTIASCSLPLTSDRHPYAFGWSAHSRILRGGRVPAIHRATSQSFDRPSDHRLPAQWARLPIGPPHKAITQNLAKRRVRPRSHARQTGPWGFEPQTYPRRSSLQWVKSPSLLIPRGTTRLSYGPDARAFKNLINVISSVRAPTRRECLGRSGTPSIPRQPFTVQRSESRPKVPDLAPAMVTPSLVNADCSLALGGVWRGKGPTPCPSGNPGRDAMWPP